MGEDNQSREPFFMNRNLAPWLISAVDLAVLCLIKAIAEKRAVDRIKSSEPPVMTAMRESISFSPHTRLGGELDSNERARETENHAFVWMMKQRFA
jgi:hypothetical protein